MERGEGADTPDSLHRLTPSQPSKRLQNNQTAVLSHSDGGDDSRLNIPPDASSSAHWSLNNGTVKSHETLWVEYNPYQNSDNKNFIGTTCWVLLFSPVCAPNVGFLTMELGMTRRGRGLSVLPVGVRLLISGECRKCEMHVVKQNKQVGTTGGSWGWVKKNLFNPIFHVFV